MRGDICVRLLLKCDGTCAETRFGLSAKRTSPFKSAGASVQSNTGGRGVHISCSNAGYTVFRGSVRVLATHSIRQFPFHSPPPVRQRLPSGFNWTLHSYDHYTYLFSCMDPSANDTTN
jgi:hypothetical protein